MNNGKKPSLQVKDFFETLREFLSLRPVFNRIGFSREMSRPVTGRSSTGVQVWGKKIIQDLDVLPSQERKVWILKKIKKNILCIIISDGGEIFLPEMEEIVGKKRIAVFSSPFSQRVCREKILNYFERNFKDPVILSGGLLEICGLGVLIIGDSGIGKSESALELVSRGHKFISDDVTQFERNINGKVTGVCPSFSRNFMEIRGLGIINIKEIFGSKVLCRRSEVNLVIRLKRWEPGKEYDRLGLKHPEAFDVLGVEISQISIPVAPGRNMATLIEVACKVHLLREIGYNASEEIVKKLDHALAEKRVKQNG